jgi:hypothetical protein
VENVHIIHSHSASSLNLPQDSPGWAAVGHKVARAKVEADVVLAGPGRWGQGARFNKTTPISVKFKFQINNEYYFCISVCQYFIQQF